MGQKKLQNVNILGIKLKGNKCQYFLSNSIFSMKIFKKSVIQCVHNVSGQLIFYCIKQYGISCPMAS